MYRICVYAISKNEEQFVDRWYNSMKEADQIFVLDTGSTDNTVNKLKKLGVNVKQEIIDPWRFDVARNKSLELIPDDYDICVCTDLDEVFVSGWREKLESVWDNDTDRLMYNYNWSLDKNDKPIVNFYIEKIHTRKNYKWTHPVHEILTYTKDNSENKKITDLITLNHYPDNTKSRSSYLPLLELSIKENPNDDRNMHYLGREYMFYHKWNECIDTLIKHLNLKSEARMWLDKAIIEAPYLRDAYVEKAILEYQLNNWEEVFTCCMKALKIKKHPKTYINEPFSFDYTIYDLLSLYYYNNNEFDLSLLYINKAINLSPDNDRLINNKNLIENKLKETSEN